MKKTLTAALAAATLTVSMAPVANAMGQELMMITGEVFHILRNYGVPVDRMDELTLGDMGLIEAIVHSGDSDAEIRSQLMGLLDN